MAIALALSGLGDHAHGGPMLASIWLVVLSFCVNGAHGMIGGAASMDFGGEKGAPPPGGPFRRPANPDPVPRGPRGPPRAKGRGVGGADIAAPSGPACAAGRTRQGRAEAARACAAADRSCVSMALSCAPPS